MAEISVIVPVYNTSDYVKRCLESIFDQTFQDIEIIAVDDGSTDGSGAILDRYQSRYPMLRVFHTENNGVSQARNYALNYASGRYILFVDSDDYMDSEMLAQLYHKIEQTGADICVCDFVTAYPDGECRPSTLCLPDLDLLELSESGRRSFVADSFRQKIYVGGSVVNKLIRKSLLDDTGVRFVDRKVIHAEDMHFYFMLLLHVKRIAFLNRPLYYYYQRAGSAMHSYTKNMPKAVQSFIESLRSAYAPYDVNGDLAAAINDLALTFFFDVLYNELRREASYPTFYPVITHAFFQACMKQLSPRGLRGKRKIFYYLYRLRLYRLIHRILLRYVKPFEHL